MKGSVLEGGDEAARYSRSSLLRSEAIYGEGFQSPGGLRSVKQFAESLELSPQSRVLDVGSGTGGAGIYFAETFGATVLGIDASSDCVALARERAAESGCGSVSFQVADARSAKLTDNCFDVVWTRDSLMYVREKDLVLRSAARWLRHGGIFLGTDFCQAENGPSDAFRAYADSCNFQLCAPSDYRTELNAAGFKEVTVVDITDELIDWMEIEKKELLTRRSALPVQMGDDDVEHLVRRWDAKLRFCLEGDLRWVKFRAEKQNVA
jgi:phosphoethanolamine N-methyltransferase